MSRLLVTFDAFGTLFAPRLPVLQQYAMVAREFGVDVDECDLQEPFKQAYKDASLKYPNYGKSIGMKPEEWWTNIIIKTFQPLVSSAVPSKLPPALIEHFASSSGYTLYPSVPKLLHTLRNNQQFQSTILGVVSNSDPRVTSILYSLGVGIKHYHDTAPGHDPHRQLRGGGTGENRYGVLDFAMLSYDVGASKPERGIWDAAAAAAGAMDGEWRKVHVGDELEKDVQGAEAAGWKGLLWDGDNNWESVCKAILGERGA